MVEPEGSYYGKQQIEFCKTFFNPSSINCRAKEAVAFEHIFQRFNLYQNMAGEKAEFNFGKRLPEFYHIFQHDSGQNIAGLDLIVGINLKNLFKFRRFQPCPL